MVTGLFSLPPGTGLRFYRAQGSAFPLFQLFYGRRISSNFVGITRGAPEFFKARNCTTHADR